MNKGVVYGATALASVLLVAVVYAMSMPPSVHVETSRVVAAAPEEVYPYLVDLRTWPDWTAWNRTRDPSATWAFSGPSGVGATMSWTSDRMGSGTVRITGVDRNRSLGYALQFQGMSAPSHGTIAIAPNRQGTRVAWSDTFPLGLHPVRRLRGPTLSVMLEADFHVGLSRLADRLAALEHAGDQQGGDDRGEADAPPGEHAEAVLVEPADHPSDGEDR
jgi:uncharacterized protein YndB with AHSA1/START domain